MTHGLAAGLLMMAAQNGCNVQEKQKRWRRIARSW